MLLHGSLYPSGQGEDHFVEYRLSPSPPSSSMPTRRQQHFDRRRAQHCLANTTIAMVGDSRMRYLYASLSSLLVEEVNDNLPIPHYRACPFKNTPHETSHECSDWYLKCGPFDCAAQTDNLHVTSASTRVAYVANIWAADVAQVARLVTPLRPDLLFTNVGAWGVFQAKGLAKKYEPSTASQPKETRDDRLNFYAQLLRVLKSGSRKDVVTAMAIGYPECGCGGTHVRMCVNKFVFDESMRTALAAAGWLVYWPVEPTGEVWMNRSYGRAWASDLLPKHAVSPAVPKWDQCQSVHTFDTLADLEVQLILNSIC